MLAHNQETGTTGSYTVTNVLVHLDPAQVHLTIGGEQIATTPEHPFYVLLRGWVAAIALRAGDQVRSADGDYGAVEAVRLDPTPRLMYNLTVAEAHTFFVGEEGWLVHNCGGNLAKPGQDLFVGTYNQVRAANIRSGLNSTHTPHHAPQNAITPTSHGTSITINLRKDIHELTSTFRNPKIATTDLRKALAGDVRELRKLLGNAGYDRSLVNRQLQELIRQNKILHNGLPKP